MSAHTGDKHLETIFHDAAALSGAERAEYLHRTCGPDTSLRQRVESLLAAHEAAKDLLPSPDPSPLSERPGVVIGRYKLLQQIGEGGFGVVFMAEQEFPLRRRVALKIIKRGMDTRQVVARFEAERQALAMMDHPGVARVFDGGETETGRPYFVMELVRGTPINAYCDAHNLTIRQRLELFSQVCHAVQHAHQKGLIHRDIKPTNVLISTAEDDSPVAKVIDFGIAKAMQARLTEKTLFTDFHQWIGTPEYMSPEQTIGSLDVDTRSDMYSLGVLLYELLAGALPFDPKELRCKAYAEMQRIIREVDPPAPSTRVSTIRDLLPAVAAHRGVEARKLAGALRGELDWIVMRCMEKDRTRRYPTASALIDDIDRYLHDLPVEARPARRIYRLKKFIRRNKVAVLAGGAVVGALVCGLALATAGLVKARREAIRADREASNAKAEAARTQRGSQFFWHFMRALAPAEQDGRDTTLVRDALDSAIANFDQDTRDASPQSTAELYGLVGSAYLTIGETARAQAMHRRALAYFQSAPGQESTRALLLDYLVTESMTLGNYDQAEAFHRDALAVSTALSGPDSAPTAAAANRLAVLLLRHTQVIPEPIPPARSAEAENLLREALATRMKLLGEKDPFTEESRSNLMDALQRRGKLDEADKLYDPLLQQSQSDASRHARILHARAMLRGYDGRWAEACADLGEAQKLDPNEDRYAFDLALALRMSGRLDDYRQHCHTFLERAAGRGDSLPTADKAAKVALLVPVDDPDRERACELADRVAGATEPPGVLPWFALCKSLADLRRQRWDSAIGWAERTIALNGAVRETQAAAYFIEASAYAQSGRAELARSTLARGQGLINQTSWNVYNESWRDWLIADLLRAEALGLIRSSPNPAVPAAATRP